MIKKVNQDYLFLPDKPKQYLIAGKALVEWDFCLVYVHDKKEPFLPPTFFYFTFINQGVALQTRASCIEQWTSRRGVCQRMYTPHCHEFKKAKKFACQVVATYRRHYLKRYGAAPNQLGLQQTIPESVLTEATEKVLRGKYGPT